MPWSRVEVEAIVADYVAMLTAELRREPYSKTAHRRALAPLLDARSDGAIERKHQNISAVLIELGFPYIFGYKPLGNYQADGRDRLIEVKTTAYGKQTPFFLSRNELAVSQRFAERYQLYRLFRFREDPRLYGLAGALDRSCRLAAVEFQARVKG